MSDNREVLHVLRARQSLIMRYVVRSRGELHVDVIFLTFELQSTQLSSSQTKYDFFFFYPSGAGPASLINFFSSSKIEQMPLKGHL